MIALCFNLFKTLSDARNEELMKVFEANCKTKNIKIHLVMDENAEDFCDADLKADCVTVKCEQNRPTYEFWFNYMKTLDTQTYKLGIICNSDIYLDNVFTEALLRVKWETPNDCFALTRWNVESLAAIDSAKFFSLHNHCSQDVWVFQLPLQFMPKYSNFSLGVWGCDNRIAHEIKVAGGRLSNPSKTLKTYHLHNVIISRKTQREESIQPPYHFISATLL